MSKYKDFTFDRAVNFVLKKEGGYVNHPNDKGGETNLGITKATALANKDIWAKHNWNGNMKTLPVSFAKEVYRRNYWDKIKGDTLLEIHPLLADHMFDLAVNSGPTVPTKHLQEALNLLNDRQKDYKDTGVDGKIGPGTFTALRAFAKRRGEQGLEDLVLTLVAMQTRLYLSLSANNETQEAFTNGWLRRSCSKTRNYSLAMEGKL